MFDYKVLSFNEFLKLVPRKGFPDRVYSFNARTSNPDSEGWSDYKRSAAVLVRGAEADVCLKDLFAHSSHDSVWKKPIGEFYDDLATQHIKMLGDPQCIVKLGSRKYTCLNPNEFQIVHGPRGVALICFAPVRQTIYDLMPITEPESALKERNLVSDDPIAVERLNSIIEKLEGRD